MNHYTIDILKADLSYVIEAIRMRGYAIAEQVASQALRQDHAEIIEKQEQEPAPWNISVTTNGEMVAEKKPAKKTAKKRGRTPKKTRTPLLRTPEAPYGLKKDGTPRGRPGRKTVQTTVAA